MDALLLAFQSDYIFWDGQRNNKFKVVIDSIENKESQKGAKLIITERYAQNDTFTDGKSLLVVGRGAVQGERLSAQSGFSEAKTLRQMSRKKEFALNIRYTCRVEAKSMTKTDVDDLSFAVFYILEFFHEKIRESVHLNTIGVPMVGDIMPESVPGQGAEHRFFTCAIEIPMQFGMDYRVLTKLAEEEQWKLDIHDNYDEEEPPSEES
jgi:hypothetical protein